MPDAQSAAVVPQRCSLLAGECKAQKEVLLGRPADQGAEMIVTLSGPAVAQQGLGGGRSAAEVEHDRIAEEAQCHICIAIALVFHDTPVNHFLGCRSAVGSRGAVHPHVAASPDELSPENSVKAGRHVQTTGGC